MSKKWSGHQMASENRATSAELNNSPLDARNVALGGIHSKAQDFYGKADAALYNSRVKRGIQNQPWPNEQGKQSSVPKSKADEVMAEFSHIGTPRKPGIAERVAATAGTVAGKVAGKANAIERRAAEIVGHIGLDAHGMSNAVTRAGVDLAAKVSPRNTLKAGAKAIMAAPAPNAEAAIGRAAVSGAKRAGRAIERTVDPIAKRIDVAERRAGDMLQSAIGVRGIGDAMGKAVDGIDRGAKRAVQWGRDMLKPAPQKGNGSSRPQGPDAPARPHDGGPVASGKGGGKQAADRGTYTTADGRTVQGTEAQQAAWKARRKEGGA